jgi:hypothetical protein
VPKSVEDVRLRRERGVLAGDGRGVDHHVRVERPIGEVIEGRDARPTRPRGTLPGRAESVAVDKHPVRVGMPQRDGLRRVHPLLRLRRLPFADVAGGRGRLHHAYPVLAHPAIDQEGHRIGVAHPPHVRTDPRQRVRDGHGARGMPGTDAGGRRRAHGDTEEPRVAGLAHAIASRSAATTRSCSACVSPGWSGSVIARR